MRDISHENINTFLGACIDPPNICILSLYCPKGSIQDIVENSDISLDWLFKCSLISDMANVGTVVIECMLLCCGVVLYATHYLIE